MISHQNILITGAGGFIGANLLYQLIPQKNTLHLIIKKTSNLWRIKKVLPSVKLYNVSLVDIKGLTKIIKRIKPTIIYHLAVHGAYPQQKNQIEIIGTNLIGTANLLIASSSINYKCFVNTGSSSEYGFKQKPMKETDLLEPNSFYAATKAAATYFCQVIAKSHHKPIITLRPFSVYGPFEEPTRFIPTVISRILKNQPVLLTSDKIRRDFIYIEDIINAYLKIPAVINKRIYGEVFNLGTGKQYTNDQVVRTIKNLLRKKIVIKKGAYQRRSWDSNFWVADISKSKKILRWKAKYGLEKGLEKTIKWFTKNYEYSTVYN